MRVVPDLRVHAVFAGEPVELPHVLFVRAVEPVPRAQHAVGAGGEHVAVLRLPFDGRIQIARRKRFAHQLPAVRLRRGAQVGDGDVLVRLVRVEPAVDGYGVADVAQCVIIDGAVFALPFAEEREVLPARRQGVVLLFAAEKGGQLADVAVLFPVRGRVRVLTQVLDDEFADERFRHDLRQRIVACAFLISAQ